tara:strand:+ start:762 stop:1031 length:270 start_codon:yes stop_codon:yes gene_type:complete
MLLFLNMGGGEWLIIATLIVPILYFIYRYGKKSGELKGLKSKGSEPKLNTLSSDEALAQLKKAKEKLSLDLITQEEFNQKREELAPLIK